MENTLEALIYKYFRGEQTIWFDFTDYVKANYEIQRKGLEYHKNKGRYEIYVVNEDGESVLFDVLDDSHGYKLERIILAFSS
jgi:hypothetical protein